jgi:uncharacterized MAPEG superfamily protein
MAAGYWDLLQTFAYTSFALVINAVFLAAAEARARNLYNAPAAPEDDLMRRKLGIKSHGIAGPVAAPVAAPAAAPAPYGAAAMPAGAPMQQVQPVYPTATGSAPAAAAPADVVVHVPGATPGMAPIHPVAPAANYLTLTGTKPEPLARANAAHGNATENFVPYLLAVVPYIIIVGFQPHQDNVLPVIILICIFTFCRWCHSFCYLFAIQPLRTLFYTIGMISMVMIACWTCVAAQHLNHVSAQP